MLKPEEQLKIITKGIQTLVNEEELLSKLERACKEEKPLVVKLGLDPSAPDIHLGHAVVLRKMKQIQDLGHKVVIIIGDFTGQIGDPTGRKKARPALSKEQVKENAETYCNQIFKILDKEKTEVRFNSEWLSKLNFEDILHLSATTTVARMLERDDFDNRYKNQIPIGIHEFFYPLMQAYDSLEIGADIEIGGTDQTFNILMGRTLQKAYGKEQQIAIFMPILEGLDGIEKMSKSLGNYIGINESSSIMFKKVMEIPDCLIIKYYDLATDEHPDKIEVIKKRLKDGENPKNIKYELAQIITELYHGKEEMEQARKFYDDAFTKKAIPENIQEILLALGKESLNDAIPQLIQEGFVKSRSEMLRLIKQGGVSLNSEKVHENELDEVLFHGDVLRIGKKVFVRFIK